MEARIGAERTHLCGTGGELELNLGNRGIEWDLNHWNWNPDLFLANPRNGIRIRNGNGSTIRSNSSSSCSEENGIAATITNTQSEAEKRKRIAVIQEENGVGSLSLRVGNGIEERDGKKGKVVQTGRPVCQVEGCGADLSGCKDYHRRHKVCETHAKASTAVVGNSVQRFCQQCSRFHLLEEFDEGKRSCRRRLAGHNKRRRKAQSDATTSALGGAHALDDKTTGCLIISLLRVLGNLHSNNTEQPKDQQDMGIHLLKNLANLASSIDIRSLSGLLQQNGSHSPEKGGTSLGPTSDALQTVASKSVPATTQEAVLPANGNNNNLVSLAVNGNNIPARVRDFDLNDACNDTEETENCTETAVTVACNGIGSGSGSPSYPPWMARNPMQNSPQQISSNSEALSGQSLSSSNGDAQCRTDRIVLKLFGKDPHDLPLDLRAQIFDWLNNTPTDVESYIKPGCVMLTIYLRLPESKWIELCEDLSYEMERLLSNCTDDFWQCGWIYATVQNEIVFIYNGRVVVDGSLPSRTHDYSNTLCVRPIAVPYSTTVEFTVKGVSLANDSMRIFCAFEGKQLFQECAQSLIVQRNGPNNEYLTLNFSCSIPDARGRGFIEVEENGFSNGFIPFIVAEKEVCSEIRALEDTMDTNPNHEESLKFLNELGWLLKKSQIILKSEKPKSTQSTFDLTRFIWLINFAIHRDWCNVIKMLLDILFNGAINLNNKSPKEVALSLDLLLNAIKRKRRGMVEILLRYSASGEGFIFKPDASDESKSKLTPLHIAASINGMDDVIDALTNDPNMIGINAWKTVRDETGQTPEDYAHILGHSSYQDLVQRKIDHQLQKSHVVIGIPESVSGISKSGNSTFEISGKNVVLLPTRQHCNSCTRQVVFRTSASRTFFYRPALLSMVGIAAVCVCVGILLHTLPEVRYVVPSFRWELVEFGAI